MSNKSNDPDIGLLIALLIIGLLVFMSPLKRFVWVLLPAIGIGALVALLFFAYRSWTKAKAKKQFEKTIEGKIQVHIDKCEAQVKKNEDEIADIKENIADIKSKMTNASELNTMTQKESQRILGGFEIELNVRKEKINFYRSCLSKLNTILANHQLAKDLELKEEKLRSLQENNYDDISEMEALKTELSFDKVYIESIENLSLRMLQSNSLESAQKLQLELQEITKELRKL